MAFLLNISTFILLRFQEGQDGVWPKVEKTARSWLFSFSSVCFPLLFSSLLLPFEHLLSCPWALFEHRLYRLSFLWDCRKLLFVLCVFLLCTGSLAGGFHLPLAYNHLLLLFFCSKTLAVFPLPAVMLEWDPQESVRKAGQGRAAVQYCLQYPLIQWLSPISHKHLSPWARLHVSAISTHVPQQTSFSHRLPLPCLPFLPPPSHLSISCPPEGLNTMECGAALSFNPLPSAAPPAAGPSHSLWCPHVQPRMDDLMGLFREHHIQPQTVGQGSSQPPPVAWFPFLSIWRWAGWFRAWALSFGQVWGTLRSFLSLLGSYCFLKISFIITGRKGRIKIESEKFLHH